jgi:hypothetical protein
VQLVNPLISNPTIDGGAINGGTATNLTLVGAQLDCTSRGCTAGANICNDGLATNAQVCLQVAAAISGGNPAFCAAVDACLTADPFALCTAVATCISTTPGIIDSTGAFGVNSRATTALFGVVRYATINELNMGNCLLAVDPCTLIAALTAPNLASPFWGAIVSAVCTAGLACFAPLNSPAFTGIPTAPTAAAGTNTTQIATTAFVTTAINNAISGANPAFCAAVSACGGAGVTCVTIAALFPAAGVAPPGGTRFLGSDCLSYTSAQIAAAGGGGGGGGTFAVGSFQFFVGTAFFPPFVTNNCTGSLLGSGPISVVGITFTTPQPDTNYVVVATANTPGNTSSQFCIIGNKTINGFQISYDTTLGVPLVEFHCAR